MALNTEPRRGVTEEAFTVFTATWQPVPWKHGGFPGVVSHNLDAMRPTNFHTSFSLLHRKMATWFFNVSVWIVQAPGNLHGFVTSVSLGFGIFAPLVVGRLFSNSSAKSVALGGSEVDILGSPITDHGSRFTVHGTLGAVR